MQESVCRRFTGQNFYAARLLERTTFDLLDGITYGADFIPPFKIELQPENYGALQTFQAWSR